RCKDRASGHRRSRTPRSLHPPRTRKDRHKRAGSRPTRSHPRNVAVQLPVPPSVARAGHRSPPPRSRRRAPRPLRDRRAIGRAAPRSLRVSALPTHLPRDILAGRPSPVEGDTVTPVKRAAQAFAGRKDLRMRSRVVVLAAAATFVAAACGGGGGGGGGGGAATSAATTCTVGVSW